MSDLVKFWIQTLIIPIILALVGYGINNTLQSQQRALEKIKFTDQIINEAFDSNKPEKALALTKIIPVLIEDKAFADTLINIITGYYLRQAKQALLTSNDSAYRRISDAATAFHGNGNVLLDSLKKDPTTSKAEKARKYEQEGLLQIQQGNLEAAHTNFKKAETIYPGFHSSYEIANLLADKIQVIKQGGDSSEAKQEVLKTVQKKYSWKLYPKTKVSADQ